MSRPETDEEACRQVLQILSLVGDKWTVLVIGQLHGRTLRFGELHRAVAGISQRILTLTLRQLERDGLLTRTVHATVPPRVEYALTELGDTLVDALTGLGTWAIGARAEITQHRHHYDTTHPEMAPDVRKRRP
ncbi:winged helix-turn-helix transcriptional regulator [Actinomadura fibrosa]|uniref:Winged helix-turn-helix transcriptional regulator n=1 Tax=Actinomadura fibrosa TaxID=111802 RepID=A0ABW2XNS3_9ACTN|nr:helix-turn-helix domain-containing protein [Actinomadura fibrosa]